jgi:SRA domain-containing protein
LIWFPKLYKNDDWNNRISDDEKTIWENSESPEINKEHIDRNLRSRVFRRIVFVRVKGPLGDVMYRFKGEYQLDRKATNYQDGRVWRRVSKRVRTYPN